MVMNMNRRKSNYTNYLNIFFFILVCLSVYFLPRENDFTNPQTIETSGKVSREKVTVVIDPGHGGRDPGKVGVNEALEKDINLNIALKLKEFLNLNDVNVVMIREEDIGLYEESDSNKKVADMRKRVDIINSSNAILAISIHQNSFTQESVKGAQVFYYSNSPQGKVYANIMQNQLIKSLKDGNTKKEKGNDSYYMLTKTTCPIVIVECGYLSNYNEANLLSTEVYQEKLAWSIHLGVMTYLNQRLEEKGKTNIN